jgi:iron(III) transport system substrate-binding protein
MKKLGLVLLVSLILSAGVLVCAGTAQEVPLTPEQDAWLQAAQLGPYQPETEDWDAIYEAAKGEGTVVFYSVTSMFPLIIEDFEKAYPGIDVEVYDMSGNEQVEKLTREQGAGIFDADVLLLSNATTVIMELLPQHLLWNYVPATIFGADMDHLVNTSDVIDAQYLSPLVNSFESKVVFYNYVTYPLLLLRPSPLTSLWDLTLPEWRQRVQMKDPMLAQETMNFIQMVVKYSDAMAAAYKDQFGEDLVLSPGIENAGYEWIKRLVANDIVLTNSDGTAAKAVGAPGQENPPVTGSVASSKLRYNADGHGTNLAIAWDLEPMAGITKSNFALIANRSPHPNAAKLLIRVLMGASSAGDGFGMWDVPGVWSPRTDYTAPIGSLDALQESTWFIDTSWVYQYGTAVQDFWLSQ